MIIQPIQEASVSEIFKAIYNNVSLSLAETFMSLVSFSLIFKIGLEFQISKNIL